jgi:hypothetical protein
VVISKVVVGIKQEVLSGWWGPSWVMGWSLGGAYRWGSIR